MDGAIICFFLVLIFALIIKIKLMGKKLEQKDNTNVMDALELEHASFIMQGQRYNPADFAQKLKHVRYMFEHGVLWALILSDREQIERVKEGKEVYLYVIMRKLCEEQNFVMPYEIADFGVEIEQDKDSMRELIRVKMPKPIQVNNCLEIVISVTLIRLRYFTVELGMEGTNLFICEWVLGEDGKPQHNNYKEIDINNEEYIEEIKKLL